MALIAKLSLLAALAAVVLGVLSGTGYQAGWWDLSRAFSMLQWTLYASGGAVILGLAGAIFSQQKIVALGGLAIGAVLGLFILMQALAGAKVPAIHDISTDTQNPPQFVKIVALRGEKSNSLDYHAKQAPIARGSDEMKSSRALQEDYYTDIKPLMLELGKTPCFELALRVAKGQGWEMVNVDEEALIIEATDTTLFFGFKDDVVIRLAADETSCRIDMRSVSRVGMSDVGVNAKRIAAYFQALKKEAA